VADLFNNVTAPSAGRLQLGAGAYTAPEGAGALAVTVTRTGGSAGAAGVTLNTADGSALAGSDYTARTAVTISWAGGDAAAKTVSIPITGDAAYEGDETFVVTLSHPTGGAQLGTPAAAIVTIKDDDPQAAPGAPSGLTFINPTASALTLTWTAPSGAVSGYRLDVSANSSFGSLVAGYNNLNVMGNVNSFLITGLAANTPYWARLRTYGPGGTSGNSASAAGQTNGLTDTQPPTAPAAVVLSPVHVTSMTVSWKAATDNIGIAGYQLDIALNSAFTSYVPGFHDLKVGNVTNWLATGLSAGTAYWVRLRAQDTSGNPSANSQAQSAVTLGGGSLPAMDLGGLEGRSYRLDEEIRLPYPENIGASFDWSFTPAEPRAAGNWPAGSAAPAGAGVLARTAFPRMTPASHGLTAGRYQMAVTAGKAGWAPQTGQARVSLATGSLDGVRVYPNPWKNGKTAQAGITFSGLPAGTTLKIFTVSGHLVRVYRTDGPSLIWDLNTDKGEPAASGVYFYRITTRSGESLRGKAGVVR
jgi:hypothetical protein